MRARDTRRLTKPCEVIEETIQMMRRDVLNPGDFPCSLNEVVPEVGIACSISEELCPVYLGFLEEAGYEVLQKQNLET